MRTRLAWTIAIALVLVLGTLPLWTQLPQPQGTRVIADALYGGDPQAEGSPVTLPHVWDRRGGQAHYRLSFHLDRVEGSPLYLFIPMLSQRAVITFAGREIFDTENRTLMFGVTSGVSALVPLPTDRLVAGNNTIELRLESQGVARGYLSALHLGTADQLAPHYRWRIFLLEHLRLMVLAGQLLIAVAVLVAFVYRPREPLFGWLFALLVVSTLAYAGLFADAHPRIPQLLPYLFMVSTAATFVLPIIALLMNGTAPPKLLKAGVVLIPLACVLLALTGAVAPRKLVLVVSVPLMLGGLLATVLIAAWGAFARRVAEAQWLLLPLMLQAIATVHDGAVAARWLDGPVYLAVYYRPVMMIGIAVILMRRLGMSLRSLDDANAHLKQRLAEQERELARLHAEERLEAAQRVRNEERQRLTLDLHDGVSGHLASIIALAEREGAGPIERTAREALDDLRVVIHSLDIGDRELPVALAGLRERLARQLKRLGIALDWSMARLPEISGVTPAHALNVLRILQEAITNACKYGPATRVGVRGDAACDAGAVIVVENDGRPFAPGQGGSGLDNMRRRAEQLGGRLVVEAIEGGTRVRLLLPLQLPQQAATQAPAMLTR